MHYLLYRVLRELYTGIVPASEFGKYQGKLRTFIPVKEYVRSMEFTDQEDWVVILSHMMHGLAREDLVGSPSWGEPKYIKQRGFDPPSAGILFWPTSLGAELFFWAHGQGHYHAHDFLNPALVLEFDITIPAIQRAQPVKPFVLDKE